MKTSLRILLAFLLFQFGSNPSPAEQIQTNWQPYVVSAPEPVIPQVCLRLGQGGLGVFVLTIDPRNGIVTEVKVVKHTGYHRLDAAAVMALFNWRFRPGTITQARIAYHMGVTGIIRGYHHGAR
jgi:TonB family protein